VGWMVHAGIRAGLRPPSHLQIHLRMPATCPPTRVEELQRLNLAVGPGARGVLQGKGQERDRDREHSEGLAGWVAQRRDGYSNERALQPEVMHAKAAVWQSGALWVTFEFCAKGSPPVCSKQPSL